jgi:hypothetical protein
VASPSLYRPNEPIAVWNKLFVEELMDKTKPCASVAKLVLLVCHGTAGPGWFGCGAAAAAAQMSRTTVMQGKASSRPRGRVVCCMLRVMCCMSLPHTIAGCCTAQDKGLFKDRVVGSADVGLTPLFMFDGTADLSVDVFKQQGAACAAQVHLKVRFISNYSVRKHGRSIKEGKVVKDRFGHFWMGCNVCHVTVSRCEHCGCAFYCACDVLTVKCSLCCAPSRVAANHSVRHRGVEAL